MGESSLVIAVTDRPFLCSKRQCDFSPAPHAEASSLHEEALLFPWRLPEREDRHPGLTPPPQSWYSLSPWVVSPCSCSLPGTWLLFLAMSREVQIER